MRLIGNKNIMKSTDDVQILAQIFIMARFDMPLLAGMEPVCTLIDPYIDAYLELHNLGEHKQESLGRFNAYGFTQGIHLAFWIMQDESSKLPTDPAAFSNLIQRCYDGATLKIENRIEIIDNIHNVTEEQAKWIAILMSLESTNRSLIFGCVWSLLQLWQHYQKQVEFRAELQRNRL